MIPTIAFLNSKGGVGRTSLVYHLAWMYADIGSVVLAVDLDPQANLTAAMIDQERLQVLWNNDHHGTLYGALDPLMRELSEVVEPHRERIGDRLELIAGDLEISRFEGELADQWARCLTGQERAFRVTTAFHRCIQTAAKSAGADVVLIDLSPYLGAINRAALVASQHIVVPLAPDPLSLQALKSLGPRVMQWREEWTDRLSGDRVTNLELTEQVMQPAGYVLVQSPVRLDRPTHAGLPWVNQVPEAYASNVLGETHAPSLTRRRPSSPEKGALISVFCSVTERTWRSAPTATTASSRFA